MLEMVITNFAWPLAIVIIAIIFMILFMSSIKDFLKRANKISRSGIEVYPISQQSPEMETSPAREMDLYESPVHSARKSELKSIIDDMNFENPDKKVEFLLKSLASTTLNTEFERLNSIIWGSQITILKKLNTKEQSHSVLKEIYDQAAKEYPEGFRDYTLENYIGFLINTELIRKNDENYFITDYGHEFLKYLIDSRANEYRNL